MSRSLIEINQSNLEAVMKQNPQLVVDCWAAWCGPCRQMSPLFDKVAEENHERAAFGKIDCDKNPELVKKFKILAIPTLLFIKEGEVKETIVGLVTKEEIESVLRKML